jgi:L-lactate dehydrogenase
MKVGVVGCGSVGSTAAYSLIARGIGREIVLVDKNAARSAAEADDLFHAVPFAEPLLVRDGEYADLAGCKVVIIAAGVNQKPGETRLQLLERNAAVFADVVPSVIQAAPDAVLVVATNPVDVMTHLTARIATGLGVPRDRVLGSGTTLDTARFRALLGEHLGLDPHHVHAYVVGEHGDSEVLCWSSVRAAGLPLAEICRIQAVECTDKLRRDIDQRVRKAAYRIIQGKGATYYGIGSALARIVDVILHDQRSIMTVCAPAADVEGVSDVTLALPRLVGGSGVIATMPLDLSGDERQLLQKSAATLKEAIGSLPG